MNFPRFHQVIVAGGLDPELRHSNMANRVTEKGSAGGEMVTVKGSTVMAKKVDMMVPMLYLLTVMRIQMNSGLT